MVGSLVAGGTAGLVVHQIDLAEAKRSEEQLRKRIIAAEDQQTTTRDELANAKQMAELWENEANKLRNRLLDYVPQSELDGLREQLTQERDALAAKLDEAREHAATLQQTLDATIQAWEQKLTASEAAAKQQVDDLRTESEARLAAASENLAKVSAARENLQAQVDELGTRLTASAAELDAAGTKLAAAEQRAADLASQVDDLRKRLAGLEGERDALRRDLDAAKKAAAAALAPKPKAEAPTAPDKQPSAADPAPAPGT